MEAEAQIAKVEESEGSAVHALIGALLAWLIPGLGHLYMGQWRKALLYFVLLNSCLIYGGSVLGNTEVEVENEPMEVKSFENISPSFPFHFAAQMGVGLPTMIIGTQNGKYAPSRIQAIQGLRSYEISTLYVDVAGLLNYLVAMHLLLMTEVIRRRKNKEPTSEQRIQEVLATSHAVPVRAPNFVPPAYADSEGTPKPPVPEGAAEKKKEESSNSSQPDKSDSSGDDNG